MTSVSLVDWKIEPRRTSSRRSLTAFEMLPLWQMAKPPDGQFGEQRLDVPQRRLAGRRIAVVADRDVALQPGDDLVRIEVAGDMAHRAVGVEVLAVEAGDARGFLPAMLERVQPERAQRRRAVGPVDADDAAFLVQVIAVFVAGEGVGRDVVHRDSPWVAACAAYRDARTMCLPSRCL